MHDYQFNLEVVSAVPAAVLDCTGDGLRHKLILRCTRRDATIECTAVPSAFEVRNAPSFELVSVALVAVDRVGGAERVEASSAEPLLVGGPHRTVGAVWVPLISTSAVDSTAAVPLAATRVFVAWSMTRMDGCEVRIVDVEPSPTQASLSASAANFPLITAPVLVHFSEEDFPSPNPLNTTHRGVVSEPEDAQAREQEVSTGAAATTTTKNSAFAVTGSTRSRSLFSHAVADLVLPPLHGIGRSGEALSPLVADGTDSLRGRGSLGSATGPHLAEFGAVSVLISRLVLGSSFPSPVSSTAEQAARVSIVLDEEQEASQQLIESDRCDFCCAPSEHSGDVSVTAHDLLHQGSADDAKSSSGAPDSSALSELAGADAGNTVAVAADFGSPRLDSPLALPDAPNATWVDYYASSTQSIGAVPIQTRVQNLYTVPSPYLLDRLKDQLAQPCLSPSSPTAVPAPVISHGLWRERHRQINASRWVGGECSAQEEIRLEHEAKRGSGALLTGMQANDGDSSASSLTLSLGRVKGRYVGVGAESSLALLRRQALDGLRPQRIMY
ncbi:hypothetical protein JIQ42_02356 [Leishmania sp. Namibia]|uniref:hypothetical protein n=1 Tax=Leishmania sp. Namibia TaxID=2802991 RepID=UPI001B7A520A|nr:hypothetical protein JIQ42_02356 [Leishmania sp. Namibia]